MFAKLIEARNKKDEGFTLIELLVVIIIIGILAAIAIPVFLNQRKKGWEAAVQADLRNAATAQETLLTESGLYSTVDPVTGNVVDPVFTAAGFKASSGANYDGGEATIETVYATEGLAYCVSATANGGAQYYYASPEGLVKVDAEHPMCAAG